MKSLIKLLALSASLAPVFADVASVSANATDLESGSSTCGEESCGMDKRGTEDFFAGGVGLVDFDTYQGQFNFYCNSRDVGKVCNSNNDKLTDANCALMCNCNQKTGKVACMSWDNCDRKFMEDKCKCWGIKTTDKSVVCGTTPVEPPNATRRPAADRVNAINKIL